MYVIAVNKSQEFLLNVRRSFNIFSTTTPPCSRRRRVIFFRGRRKGFDFDDESMFFSTTNSVELLYPGNPGAKVLNH